MHSSDRHLHMVSYSVCIVPIDLLDKSDKQTFSVDKQKKQMSDGHSICPLDPMDTQKSNGKLEVHQIHLTNGMSNGLLIFPSDILHRYWTCTSVASSRLAVAMQTSRPNMFCQYTKID
jgi:hypothetical protein